MDERPNRRALILVAVLVIGGVMLSFAAIFGGGQVKRILSTVGSSVTSQDYSGGTGTGGTTGDPIGGDAGGGANPTAGPANGGQIANAGATVPALLIVRTGELEIIVADLGVALRDGDAAVVRSGGYVSESSRTASSGSDTARVTYRIPSGAWQATLDSLHGLATHVDKEVVKTDEVTGQVVDLTARIANLRASEAALQAIMSKAAKISDVLDVQGQLTTTRGEIEKLVGEKAQIEDQASFGSLAVTFRIPVAPTPTRTAAVAKGWDPGDDITRASGKLIRIGQTTTSVGIWLAIVGLPIVVGGAVIFFASWQLYRVGRWVARRREAVVAGS